MEKDPELKAMYDLGVIKGLETALNLHRNLLGLNDNCESIEEFEKAVKQLAQSLGADYN